MSIDWNELKSVIDAASRIVLTSHIRPDCDALGSQLGMAGLLRQMDKHVRIVNGQATPPNLAFIDPRHEILCLEQDIQAAELMDADLWMILDTSAWAQLGPMGPVIREFHGRKIIFDHHVGEDDLNATPFKDTTAEATGRLVVEAAEAFGLTITPEMANPLFAAVATDTGWFRFPSAGTVTYEVAARLIDAGASPSGVFADLYERETLGRLRLKGLVLTRIETELAGLLAHTWIRKEDFASTGALPSDTEDLVNHCLEIQGTEFAVILIEQESGGFKISFRSRCDVACNELASRFGGGGHKAAAGAFIKGSFEEVQPLVLNHVRESLQSTTRQTP
jgi:phosphoesterase RecJ-like protein